MKYAKSTSVQGSKPFALSHRPAIILTLVLFAFLFSSCRDKENAQIDASLEGYVIDAVTEDSVANARVEIWEDDKGGSNQHREYDRLIASGTTDNNGHFLLHFKCDDIKTRAVLARKQHYYYSEQISMDLIHCDTKKINRFISPLSWVRIHIKNVNPISDDDSLYFHHGIALKGMKVDTVFYEEFMSEVTRVDIWDITKNQQTVRKGQITACAPLDTCLLEIFY